MIRRICLHGGASPPLPVDQWFLGRAQFCSVLLEDGLEPDSRCGRIRRGVGQGSFPDFHFVCGIFYRDLILHDPGRYASLLPLIEASYRQCIEIGETDRYDSVAGTGSYAAWYNLGNYYEVIGDRDKAIECYRHSASYQYKRALQRLHEIGSRSV